MWSNLQEEPSSGGQAPDSIEDVDSEGSSFWCNPEVEKCGFATWGNWISPETAV